MVPVYGAMRPINMLNAARPNGTCDSRRHQSAIDPPGASSDFTWLSTSLHYRPAARNFAIVSFRNVRSSGFAPAPAGCPHSDGMGTSDTEDMNCAS